MTYAGIAGQPIDIPEVSAFSSADDGWVCGTLNKRLLL
jgi:hypothetical protein